EGLVAIDLPACMKQLLAPNVPKLNADDAAMIFPSSLQAADELTEELLSFYTTDYREPPNEAKPKTQRLLSTPHFANHQTTEAFEALSRRGQYDDQVDDGD